MSDNLFSFEKVRFCDPTTRLAILRVPREFCATVRCALTFLTAINKRRVVLTVHSIHGCARTAKVHAIRKVKRIWRERLLISVKAHDTVQETSTNQPNKVSRKEAGLICRSVDDVVNDILNMGY